MRRSTRGALGLALIVGATAAPSAVTLDRSKADEARALVRAKSLSETIDLALDRLIQVERLRRDIAKYTTRPATPEELAIADLPVRLDLGDDEVDYDAIYGKRR